MFWLIALKIKSKLSAVIFVFVILQYIHMECLRAINNMVSNECVSCDVSSSEVLVLADIRRPFTNVTFYNVLAWQGSSFCNTVSFQVFALRDTGLRDI